MFQPKYRRFFRKNLYLKIKNKINFFQLSNNLSVVLNNNKTNIQIYTTKIYYQN